MRRSNAFIFGYSRDSVTGKILNYHKKTIANVIHRSSGSGNNTDQFAVMVYETE